MVLATGMQSEIAESGLPLEGSRCLLVREATQGDSSALDFLTQDGEQSDYRAVPVTGAEHDRVDSDNGLGVFFRILTGFPPRYFVRLDPR